MVVDIGVICVGTSHVWRFAVEGHRVSDCDRCLCLLHSYCSPRCKAHDGEPSPARMRVKDMPASVTDSLDSLDAAMDAIGRDRLEQGCFRKCAETTRANTWRPGGMSRFRSRRRLWIPNLCGRVVLRETAERGLPEQAREYVPSFACEIAVESRIASMRLRREARTRRAGGDASQPTTVRGFLAITGCAMPGFGPSLSA